MATKNEELQELEQNLQETAENTGNGINIMVSQTNGSESKVADTLDEGWEADGVAIVENGETLLIVSLNESQAAFGGDLSEDLEEDIPSPSMSGLDGEMRSAFLLEFYHRSEMEVPALEACTEFGWLPSGGEMALIHANKTAINEVIEALGGTVISEDSYWTSQRFSNDRMWHCNMADGSFGIAIGTASTANVRAVKK